MRIATIAILIALCTIASGQVTPESEVADALLALCRAARAGESAQVQGLMDGDRLLAEVESWAGRDSLKPRDIAIYRRNFPYIADQVKESAASQPDILAVRMIREGTESVLVAKHVYPDGNAVRMRWRFAKSGPGWRVFDVGPIGYHMPLSLTLATGLNLFRDDATNRALIPISTLVQAAAALDAGETAKARGLLAAVESDAFPPRIEGVRQLFVATLLIFEDRPAAALAALARAATGNPGMPFVNCLSAYALNRRGEHEKALDHATKFIEATAGDAEGFHQAALALIRLGRDKEAEAAFAKALADDPGSLPRMAESLLTPEGLPALTTLVGAARSVTPKNPNLDFFDVQILSLGGRHAEAAARLLPLLAKLEDGRSQDPWRRFYLDEMIDAGRPLTGAAALREWPGTLRHVGDHLVTAKDVARLDALVLLHSERFPDDPWLHYYRAEARVLAGDHAAAEKAFAAGVAVLTSEADREEFRAARVYNLFRAGRAIDALSGVGPRGRTLKQLVWLHAQTGDRDGLTALLAAQERANATLPAWLYCSTEPAWLDGDHASVVARLLERRKEILADRELLYDFENRVIRGLIRMGKGEEALAAAREIEKRDDDVWYVALALASLGRAEETNAVLARLVGRGFTREQMYGDEDLGPALRGEGMEGVRKEFPAPR